MICDLLVLIKVFENKAIVDFEPFLSGYYLILILFLIPRPIKKRSIKFIGVWNHINIIVATSILSKLLGK